MRKLVLSSFIVATTYLVKAQTVPTTTVGALQVKDSLNVVKDITAQSDVTINGEVLANDTLRAIENIIAEKDIQLGGSILFDNTGNQLKFTPATATKGEGFMLGKGLMPNQAEWCLKAQQDPWFYFAGKIQLFDQTLGHAVTLGSDGAGSTMETTGQTNALKINYYCGKPTFINTGWDIPNGISGGRVSMGAEVEMQRSLRIGWNGNSNMDLNTAIEINQSAQNANGVIVKTWEPTVKAFAVEYTNGNTGFEVLGSGATKVQSLTIADFIGLGNRNVQVDATGKLIIGVAGTQGTAWQLGGNIGTGMSFGTTDNFDLPIITNNQTRITIDKNGNVYFGPKKIIASHIHANSPYQFDGKVACKELVVVDPIKWADFVFDKNYKLLSLPEVETFYKNNKHLPNVPSEKEVKENGINTVEMDAILLQKIEELTLYIVQQQKEIEALKKEMKK